MLHLYDQIVQLIKDSSESFLGSGVILTSLVGLGASLRRVPSKVGDLIYSRVVYKVEVENNSIIYNYITLWLNERKLLFKPKSVKCVYNLQEEDGINIVGSPGNTLYFIYGGKLCWYVLNREAIETTNVDSNSSGIVPSLYRETIEVSILNGDVSYVDSLIKEATNTYKEDKEDSNAVDVYTHSNYGEWNYKPTVIKNPRTFTNLSYTEDIKESLLSDLDQFIASKELYAKRCIKYRRGYLLYGPPGTGKSSVVEAIAHRYGYSIAVLRLRGLEDSDLISVMESVPSKRIILLEDMDSIYKGKQLREGKDAADYPSYEALLNCISGVASKEEVILIITTNNIDYMDSTLVRPGRLDKQLYLGYVTREQVRDMYYKFMLIKDVSNPAPDEIVEADWLIAKLVSKYGSLHEVTPAMVTSVLVEDYMDVPINNNTNKLLPYSSIATTTSNSGMITAATVVTT